MNPLTLLPLLAAAALAAPGAHIVYQQPALGYAQVPLTQTVHYAAQPVVTGYSTTVVKPALAAPVAPIAVQGTPYYTYQYARQIPGIEPTPPSDLPQVPGAPGAPGGGGSNNGTDDMGGGGGGAPGIPMVPGAPAPPADLPVPGAPGQGGGAMNGTGNDMGGGLPVQPTPPADLPQVPGAPGGGNGNGTGNDQGGLPIPAIPGGGLVSVYNPGHFQLAPLALQSSDAVVVQARSLPVAAVRAAQAGDFEPLVTKEKVLAPVRSHTQITPQYTQIQPEVTYRKIVHDVPVATPVAVNQPVYQQFVV